MPFRLPPASTEDIIRATLKDDALVRELAAELHSAAALLLPRSTAASWRLRDALTAAARVLYHWFASRIRTPGEEYSGLVAVAGHPPGVASRSRRALVALLASLPVATVRTPWTALVAGLERLHLALFYTYGQAHHPALRALRVRFVRVEPARDHHAQLQPAVYRVLAILLAAHTLLSAMRVVRAAYRRACQARVLGVQIGWSRLLWLAWARAEQLSALEESAKSPQNSTADASGGGMVQTNRACSLCLAAMTAPTITPCGHVFCWNCVVPWCVSKKICPMCRRHAPARKLVCLYQY